MGALNLVDRSISKIFLIDDNPIIREGYEDAIEDLGVETQEITIVSSLDDLYQVASANDGFICDFHLNNALYSPVNGDVIVAGLYERKIPAVLCSRDAETAHSVRRFRHSIPSILSPRELSSDSVLSAFAACINEFSGKYSRERRPWETLVRFEELVFDGGDSARVYIVVPGWDTKALIEIEISRSDISFYEEIVAALRSQQTYRCKAFVNLDAVGMQELYVKDWVSI